MDGRICSSSPENFPLIKDCSDSVIGDTDRAFRPGYLKVLGIKMNDFRSGYHHPIIRCSTADILNCYL